MGAARWLAVAIACTLTLGACRAPVGVTKLSPQMAHRENTRSVLDSDALSIDTEIVLRRYGLLAQAQADPESVIEELHATLIQGGAGYDQLFALAELSVQHAADVGSRGHYLAAAVYAYAFLFPAGAEPELSPIDPRIRVACDMYNRAVAHAFADADGGAVVPASGNFALPFGSLAVEFDPASLDWGYLRLIDLRASSGYAVRGLRNRYRRAGIGAPLAAATEPRDAEHRLVDFVPPEVRVATTLLLRIDDPRAQLRTSQLHGTLELYATTEEPTIEVDDRTLPLEAEPSVALASALIESAYWKRELRGFLGDLVGAESPSVLFGMEPHRHGRIPIVFVHGTHSSPARWADMVNDLASIPGIDRRYEFWFFRYNSGSPIPYSAMLLRRALVETVDAFDPDGEGACLRQMVVVGHSQGGLLTKMTAIDSGSKLWDTLSDRPIEEAPFSDETRALVRDAMFVEPLPFVARTVFISTPQRGSFLASSALARRLASRLIKMPSSLLTFGAELGGLNPRDAAHFRFTRGATSIDNMSPSNDFIQALASIPVSPSVTANSIIPVKDDTPLEDADDGVVKYMSAHIDEAESELIVRSGHSTQSNPHTIEEMRRILTLHEQQTTCGATDGMVPPDARRTPAVRE